MLSAVTATTLCFVFARAALSLENGTVPYNTLALSAPLNWKTKTDAGGGSVIETLYKPYAQYNASGWTRYMLAECESLAGGTCVGYSELTTGAYNTEQPYRIWWGIVYGDGVKLGLGDFRRDISENDQIQDTFALVVRDSAADTTSSASGTMSTSTSLAATTTVSAQTDARSGVSTSMSATDTGSMSMTGTTAAPSSTAAGSTSASPATSTGAGHQLQPSEFMAIGLTLLVAAVIWDRRD